MRLIHRNTRQHHTLSVSPTLRCNKAFQQKVTHNLLVMEFGYVMRLPSREIISVTHNLVMACDVIRPHGRRKW